MYIGPWQEFKLARILQIKDKLDQEAKEDNLLPEPKPNLPQKAYSVGGKLMPTSSNQKADSRINMRR
jgi:hypothetical protein